MGESRTRVITKVDHVGKSVFDRVGPPGTVIRVGPGLELSEMWRLDAPPTSPADGYDPSQFSLEPSGRGIVFRTFVIPPDSEMLPQLETLHAQLGGLLPVSFDADTYGMHQTPTIDFITVISGEIDLRLDDGKEVRLKPGDCVVQRGTMHSWRNRTAQPCLMSAVMIGTKEIALLTASAETERCKLRNNIS
jgi:mannose-6-phosphate isomerase-like protein (cupin superfamily)